MFSLPNLYCLCLPIQDVFTSDTQCSVSCLIENNAGLYLYAYLLLFTYKFVYYKMCTCLYIQRWCFLLDYKCDAYWLCYLNYVGCAALCMFSISSKSITQTKCNTCQRGKHWYLHGCHCPYRYRPNQV